MSDEDSPKTYTFLLQDFAGEVQRGAYMFCRGMGDRIQEFEEKFEVRVVGLVFTAGSDTCEFVTTPSEDPELGPVRVVDDPEDGSLAEAEGAYMGQRRLAGRRDEPR